MTKAKLGTVNFPVGDFLIKIKNASMATKKEVETRPTKQSVAISEVLKKEGFLESYKIEDGILKVRLAFRSKKPVLLGLKIVSTPGLRIYFDIKGIEKKRSPSIYLINSSRGVITSKKAIKDRIGGEIIAEVW
ncbi:30S ribosomal protein S8 [Candidatus Woesebacteria bacterium]|nr:30S ribosomal protein S8 [Candidatus Woesebacteria bacterium]